MKKKKQEEQEKRKNKNKLKNFLSDIFWLMIVVLSILFIIGVIGFFIYIWIKYGGKPISEIPAWVAFFMFRGRGR